MGEKRGESAAIMILPLCITCILFGPVGINLGYVIAGICPSASVSHFVSLDRCGSRKIMLCEYSCNKYFIRRPCI